MKKEAKEKKPMVVEVSTINWLAPTAVANELPHRLTIPMTIEYLTKHGCFKVAKRNFIAEQGGFNERRFEERIEALLVGEWSHAIKTFRYKVLDWGDAPFKAPKEGNTLFVRQ